MRSSDQLVLFLALRLAASQALASFSAFLLEVEPCLADAPWSPTAAQVQLAQRQAAALRALGITALLGSEVPARLRAARPCTPCLFVRGDPTLLQAPAIALVGSRKACATAVQWAASHARACAQSGQVVVSGGARGVDAAAHVGALAAGGCTLAYVGCAVDAVYPQENRSLFQRILSHGGAIVSEHPPMTVGAAWHHAARNRFIAAHAHTLVVVEAAAKSGTLGTARWAHRLKRTILVSPVGVAKQRGGIEMLLDKGMASVADASADSAQSPTDGASAP